MKSKKIIIGQIIFLVVIGIVIYSLYPRTSMTLNGNTVKFSSINANLIILSENPDFSNPRYLDINDEVEFSLKPGKYYWKSSNSYIEGLKKELIIDSEVGLSLEGEEELVNIGNVKINVTKKDGKMVGNIILDIDESENVSNEGEYTGRQQSE